MLQRVGDEVETLIVVDVVERSVGTCHVHRVAGGEDNVVTLLHHALGHAAHPIAPVHDVGRGTEGSLAAGHLVVAAFDGVVPADHLAALLLQIVMDAVHEVALQGFVGLESESVHQLPALRALAPGVLLHLVGTDVDVVRGEDVHHLVENVLQEGVHLLLGGRKGYAEDGAPAGFACGGELRIDG